MNAFALGLFRSRTQFHLLGELFTNPGNEFTVGELAHRIRAAQPTVSREVARLSDHGVVGTRRSGNRTLVRARVESPTARDLQGLLAKLYGPAAELRTVLREVKGLETACIFGSWAARWHGEVGPPPNDIDLLVIGEVSHDAVWTAAARASNNIGLEVTPVIRTRKEWEGDSTGFAEEVKRGPQVDVTPQSGD